MTSARVKQCEEKVAEYEAEVRAYEAKNEDGDYDKDIAKATKSRNSWMEKLDAAREKERVAQEIAERKRVARENVKKLREERGENGDGRDDAVSTVSFGDLWGPMNPTQVSQPIPIADEYEAIITQNIPSTIPNTPTIPREEILKKIHTLEIACGMAHDTSLDNADYDTLLDTHKCLSFTVKKLTNSSADMASRIYIGLVVNSPVFLNLYLPQIGITVDEKALNTSLHTPENVQAISEAFAEMFEDDPYLRDLAIKVTRGVPKLLAVTSMAFATSLRYSPSSSDSSSTTGITP